MKKLTKQESNQQARELQAQFLMEDIKENLESVYVTADHHFFHRRINEYEPVRNDLGGNPDVVLMDLWNETINHGDRVIHLGDLHLGSREQMQILKKLKGKKYLIRGNHDVRTDTVYREIGFNIIDSGFAFSARNEFFPAKRFVFSHEPETDPFMDEWTYNIHGHLHSKSFTGPNKERYKCVSIEQTDFKPVKLWEVLLEMYMVDAL